MNELKYCQLCDKRTFTLVLDKNEEVCAECRIDRSIFVGKNREDYLLKTKATFIFFALLACVILILYLISQKLFF